MKSFLFKSLSLVAAAVVLPSQLMAHPGHEGHGMPVSAPLNSSDMIAATVIVAGLWGVRALWKAVRSR